VTRRRLLWAALAFVLALAVAVAGALPLPYAGTIRATAVRFGVDPYLVAAVIRVESGFRPNARSVRGAQGLMQLMPGTAAWIAAKTGVRGPLTDPDVNVSLGVWYLHYLLRHYHGNLKLALAAYNSGPDQVDQWLAAGRIGPGLEVAAIPYAETRIFVGRVLWYYRAYRIVYGWWPGG
jgi:soluble lytic murein transglycosylase